MIEGLDDQISGSVVGEGDGPSLLTVLAYLQLIIGILTSLVCLFALDMPINLLSSMVAFLYGITGFAVFRGFSRVIELLEKLNDK